MSRERGETYTSSSTRRRQTSEIRERLSRGRTHQINDGGEGHSSEFAPRPLTSQDGGALSFCSRGHSGQVARHILEAARTLTRSSAILGSTVEASSDPDSRTPFECRLETMSSNEMPRLRSCFFFFGQVRMSYHHSNYYTPTTENTVRHTFASARLGHTGVFEKINTNGITGHTGNSNRE